MGLDEEVNPIGATSHVNRISKSSVLHQQDGTGSSDDELTEERWEAYTNNDLDLDELYYNVRRGRTTQEHALQLIHSRLAVVGEWDPQSSNEAKLMREEVDNLLGARWN